MVGGCGSIILSRSPPYEAFLLLSSIGLVFFHSTLDGPAALSSRPHRLSLETTAMTLSSSSSSSTTISATFLGLLAASAGIPFVAAAEITTDDLYAKINPTAALPGFNVEGGSVFTHVAKAMNEGQLFWRHTKTILREVPESAPFQKITSLDWCSDLTFSDVNNSSLIGYAGRCVGMGLTKYADILASAPAAHNYVREKFHVTVGISAVFVEQTNVFEGQLHADTDDWVSRYWDDGRKTSPYIMWRGHDEGNMRPSAAINSVSGFGEFTWMSVEEVDSTATQRVCR